MPLLRISKKLFLDIWLSQMESDTRPLNVYMLLIPTKENSSTPIFCLLWSRIRLIILILKIHVNNLHIQVLPPMRI